MLVSYHFSFPSSLKTLTAQMFDKIVQLVASDGDVVSKTISVQEQSKQDHVVFVSYPSGMFITDEILPVDEEKGGLAHSEVILKTMRNTDSLDTNKAILCDGTGVVGIFCKYPILP